MKDDSFTLHFNEITNGKTIKEYQEDVEKLLKENFMLKHELSHYKASEDMSNHKINNQANEMLENELKLLRNERKKNENEINSIKNENLRLINCIENLNTNLEKAGGDCMKIKSDNEKMSGYILKQNDIYAKNEVYSKQVLNENSSLKQRIGSLENENHNLKVEIENFKLENSNLVQENNNIKNIASNIKLENDDLKNVNGNIKLENNNIKSENVELRGIYGNQKSENDNLKRINGNINAEYERIKAEYEKLAAYYKQEQNSIMEVDNDNKRKTNEIVNYYKNEIELIMKQRDQTNTNLHVILKDFNEKINFYNKNIKSLSSKTKDMKLQVVNLRDVKIENQRRRYYEMVNKIKIMQKEASEITHFTENNRNVLHSRTLKLIDNFNKEFGIAKKSWTSVKNIWRRKIQR